MDVDFEGIESFVPHKILKQNPHPEYYNKEVKRLKAKIRRIYIRRKLGEHHQAELKSYPKIVDSEKNYTGNILELSIIK